MSNIHVGVTNGNEVTLVVHIDVPAGNNTAGITWVNAVARSGLYKGTSVLPAGDGTGDTISTAEANQLAAFTRIELIRKFTPQPGLTLAQKGTAVDAFYADESAKIITELQGKLDLLGVTR
jgi:hypothetical protein